MTCTERPRELDALRASIERQMAEAGPSATQEDGGDGRAEGTILACELEWGEEAFARSPLSEEGTPPFDAIILAELVYNANFHEILLWTLQRFCHPGVVGGGDIRAEGLTQRCSIKAP